jgi:nucleoside-diphosphate-sugar epimerase
MPSSLPHLLISAGPNEAGDPILAGLANDIAKSAELRSIVYLSSLGVYGDHAGAWVDETATTIPAHARGGVRLAAEQAWQALGQQRAIPVAVLRLAGIYGPGQNVFTRLLAGRAHRVAKPGHVFNRIHVADIAQAIDAALAQSFDGVVNVTDDEPAPYSDQLLMAAKLLGVEPPKELSMDEARTVLTPMLQPTPAAYGEETGSSPRWRAAASPPIARSAYSVRRGYEARDPPASCCASSPLMPA